MRAEVKAVLACQPSGGHINGFCFFDRSNGILKITRIGFDDEVTIQGSSRFTVGKSGRKG
jgi:hypothetical protein